jgi:hypothetical protein
VREASSRFIDHSRQSIRRVPQDLSQLNGPGKRRCSLGGAAGGPVGLLELGLLLPSHESGGRDPDRAGGLLDVALRQHGGNGVLQLALEFCAVSSHLFSPVIIWPASKEPQLDWLENGKIEKLAAALRKTTESITNPELIKTIRNEAEYFDSNQNRMRYPEFRKKNLFVGSGVIEAGCKAVIGSRLKQSGMFWTVRGANAIIALRCCCVSGKFETYWEDKAA